MKTVWVAKREYDRAGYNIVGIFSKKEDAERAVELDQASKYGEFHSVAEIEIDRYYEDEVLGTQYFNHPQQLLP